ncbi:hypothetical protein ACFWXA_24290 [Streptomyces atroolivaceus]
MADVADRRPSAARKAARFGRLQVENGSAFEAGRDLMIFLT